MTALGDASQPVLITGGAGFIGTNLAGRLLASGTPVRILDNFARPGVEANARWLLDTFTGRVELIRGDVRDLRTVTGAVDGAAAVFHLAAQVAVTTSLADPRQDFSVNALGTLNVLEAVRALEHRPMVFFTSTNKVYGALADVELTERSQRYEPAHEAIRRRGISETRPLDFHSPYGCSKGAADAYVLDYARCYGLPSVVFRMSCIYGPHQMGTEDQGWVAHFLIRALEAAEVTLFGDGKQVRDVLFVEDLVNAFLSALQRPEQVVGRAFNIGGGPERTLSLLELLAQVQSLLGRVPALRREPWRVGDQRYYVSDTALFQDATGWRPQVDVATGLERLCAWLVNARGGLKVRREREAALR